MDTTSSDRLDALIESALAKEALLPLPPGFEQRWQQRFSASVALERERRLFRRQAALVCVAVLAACAGAGWLGRPFDFCGIPGGQGYADYVAIGSPLFMPGLIGAAAMLLLVVLGMAAFLARTFHEQPGQLSNRSA